VYTILRFLSWEHSQNSPKGFLLQRLRQIETVALFPDTRKELIFVINFGNQDEVEGLLARRFPACRQRRRKEEV